MSHALRVAFLIDRWQPRRGGAERALAQFAEHLTARGHRVDAFGMLGPRAGEAAPGHFHRVHGRGWTRAQRERSFAEAALSAAREAGCELTVGVRHLPRVDLYWPHGGSHAETLELLGKPVRGRHRAFLEFERELLDRGGARRVVCVSELVRAELARRHPACASRLVLVPNGVDLERFHPDQRAAARRALLARFPVPTAGPLLGFVGRNPWLKGLDVLLEALAGLPREPWSLVVAGPARTASWRQRATRLGIAASRLVFASDLPAVELAAGVDLSLVPTRRDTCSLALLEALACGTPVLASARAGAAECIGEGAGELLPFEEGVDGWRAALRRWIVIAGEVNRCEVRRHVEDRGLEPWLGRMETTLIELACARDATL